MAKLPYDGDPFFNFSFLLFLSISFICYLYLSNIISVKWIEKKLSPLDTRDIEDQGGNIRANTSI